MKVKNKPAWLPGAGTISVDFAGTKDEAQEFAKLHGREFPNGLTLGRGGGERSPNKDYMLFARFIGWDQKKQAESKFGELGWGPGEVG